MDGLPPVAHGSKKDVTIVRQPMLEFPLGWITRDENNAPLGFSLIRHLLRLCPFKFVYNSYTLARTQTYPPGEWFKVKENLYKH